MNPEVDQYLDIGCGRCPLGGTPDCKVNDWQEELKQLRLIILESGLTEEVKWSVPCYTYKDSNVLILSAFKSYCSVSFFKGSLLKDPHDIMVKPGKNSQAARLFKYTSVDQVTDTEHILKEYIKEAIEIEKAGKKVPFKKNPEPIPDELQAKFDEDPVLQEAFEALTPGRQRGYIIHFSGAKQSSTRKRRIEKCIPKIMGGKGFHDY
ncbi:YdeI/OmpD-associated family protein [Gracilimonas sp. BCB1]|uniref:YdeI/OmpD-associated family protein n=1 Tax=Gracilimonas sp. BCB1 TaxID=3152362 RepID=UPI0032D94C72